MKLVFVSNFINHHQIPLGDRLSRLCSAEGGSYIFIQTEKMDEERLSMGWEVSKLPEYVRLFDDAPDECRKLIMDADCVIFGGVDDESYIEERIAANGLVLRYSERLYKEGQWKAVSPRGLIKKYHDHTRHKSKPVYLLCAGAYVASDYSIVRAYKDKMYVWGYFPEVKKYDIDELMKGKHKEIPHILWAGRFIDWKHPEMAVSLAEYLKKKNIPFHLDIVGGGGLENALRELVTEKELSAYVSFEGYKTPGEVREYMENSDIFIHTSDRKEGWGAVLNEAMNSGCAVVADHMIGAVPYLTRHNYNGLIYMDGNKNQFYAFVEKLLKDAALRDRMGRAAYETMADEWNPDSASKKLYALINELLQSEEGTIEAVKEAESGGRKIPCDREFPTDEGRMYQKLIREGM